MEVLSQPQFFEGLRQFNAREFFDCHDTLEEIWKENNGEERLFLQGLIQVAVAYYHMGNGKFSGAYSQITKAIEKLAQYPEDYAGLDIGTFLTTLRFHRTVFKSVVTKRLSAHAARVLVPPTIQVHSQIK